MCDSFVALPEATANNTVIFGKSADCQINEALALVRIPGHKHVPGEVFRCTHIPVAQVEETYEVILAKSFWTWGAEIGINEHGVAIGNEAVHTTLQQDETFDGIMTIDMVRLGLERGRTSREAVEAMAIALEEYGQGGNCELSGNSHFDGSFLISDKSEAWILETAGREWAARKVTDSIDSISNLLCIGDDWDLSSLQDRVDWATTFSNMDIIPELGSRQRKACSYDGLAPSRGKITVRTALDTLRYHGDDYLPEERELHTNICVHAGPHENCQWQATGAMVAEASSDGIVGWFTATAATCISIFKPVFPGTELPELGPLPSERFDPASLWWRHERLHRRVMADFTAVMPEIRRDFEALENEFLTEAPSVLKGTVAEKKAFMDHCFRQADEATETWIKNLSSRSDLSFSNDHYREMWQKYNSQAALQGMPA